MKQPDGERDRHPDAQIARENGHKNPVGEIGAKAPLLPPGAAPVAGRNLRQQREHQAGARQPGRHMPKCYQDLVEDIESELHQEPLMDHAHIGDLLRDLVEGGDDGGGRSQDEIFGTIGGAI